MVKVESKKLVDFLTISTLNGKYDSVVLNFKSDGLHIQSKDGETTTANVSFMPSDKFQVYKYFEKPVGIKNSNMLIGVLKTFNGVVNLNITEDLFTVYNENKSASLKTAPVIYLDKNYLSVVPPIFEMFDAGVKINSDIFKNSVKNMSVVSSEKVLVNISNGVINVEVGDSQFDRITEKMPCTYRDVKSKFNGDLFKSVISVMPGEVNVSLFDKKPEIGFPMQLIYETENYKGRILIASLGLDGEEEVKSEEPKTSSNDVKASTAKESFNKEHPEPKVTTNTKIENLVDEEVEVEIDNSDLTLDDYLL
jgi:hypothetical protein